MSFIDILMGMRKFGCGYLAKAATKNAPIIGSVATSLQTVYVDRSNANDREKVFNQILEFQSNFLNGKASTPIMIFPEGTTTSGRDLLKFKKRSLCFFTSFKASYDQRKFKSKFSSWMWIK